MATEATGCSFNSIKAAAKDGSCCERVGTCLMSPAVLSAFITITMLSHVSVTSAASLRDLFAALGCGILVCVKTESSSRLAEFVPSKYLCFFLDGEGQKSKDSK